MPTEMSLKQLVELVGLENLVNLLKESGKKAGEDKNWAQVAKISDFIEALESDARTWQK